MNDFKEWLSDNLRYFIVGVVVILIIGGSILGIRFYSSVINGKDKVAVINSNTEKITESKDQKDTEKQTESKEKETVKKEPQTETVKTDDKKDDKEDDKTQSGENSRIGTDGNSAANGAEQPDDAAESSQTEAVQTEPPAPETVWTEPVETDPPAPVYMTLNGACYMRSYPDYGNNIIGEYSAGTTAEVLADVGGWYEVCIDGVTGYIGARFFQ